MSCHMCCSCTWFLISLYLVCNSLYFYNFRPTISLISMETSLKLLELPCFFDLNKVYLPTYLPTYLPAATAPRTLGMGDRLTFRAGTPTPAGDDVRGAGGGGIRLSKMDSLRGEFFKRGRWKIKPLIDDIDRGRDGLHSRLHGFYPVQSSYRTTG